MSLLSHTGSSSRPARVFRSRVVSTLQDVGLTGHAWNQLASRSLTNTVFQTHQWMRSWVATFGHGSEPVFISVSDGRAVTGVAPFVLDRSRSYQATLRFAGHGRADYCDILAGSDHRENLDAIVAALAGIDDWDMVKLSNVPSTSPTVSGLPQLCAERGWHVAVRDQFACPALVVRGLEAEARRIQHKASLRRRVNFFNRLGRLDYRDCHTHEAIEPYLERMFAQHIERRTRSGHDSMFNEPNNRRLYYELTSNFSGTGWVLFSVALLNDAPIACHFGFDYNDVVTWYKPTFDSSYASRSPGLLMVKHLIDYTVAQGRRELDFTVGDEPFKRRFTNVTRQTVEISISRSRIRFEANRLWTLAQRVRRNGLWP
jgi:CelD/BcsL family acetyltransferase involved in cellulose biosynthesis